MKTEFQKYESFFAKMKPISRTEKDSKKKGKKKNDKR